MEERCYQKGPSVISKTIDDEIVLVPIRENVGDLEKIYNLKGVGARIWELIDGKKSVNKIKNLLIEEYDAKPQEIGSDLASFLRELEKKGCVRACQV